MLFRFDEYDRTFDLMNQLHRRLDRVFDGPAVADRVGLPSRVHLHDGDDALLLQIDLPGVREADLQLELKDEVLTLTGKREVTPPEGYKVHQRERRPFTFTRAFALPTRVDAERVRATLTDGVLTVKLAKAEAARPRQIAVTAG